MLAFVCWIAKKLYHRCLSGSSIITPLKLTIKTPEQHHSCRSCALIVDFVHSFYIGFLTYFTYFINSCLYCFEQVKVIMVFFGKCHNVIIERKKTKTKKKILCSVKLEVQELLKKASNFTFSWQNFEGKVCLLRGRMGRRDGRGILADKSCWEARNSFNLDGTPTKIKWKIHTLFTLYVKFWRYPL